MAAVATALVVTLAAAVVAGAPAAFAHESDPAVVTVLDSITPELPEGVTVQVASSVAAQLLVENTTSTPLIAIADTGEEFLRVSAKGVEANLGSRAWYESNAPQGRAQAPAGALGPPRFAVVQSAPSWGWFDHRLHPSEIRVTPEVRAAKGRSRLAEWTVPLRYGETAITVRGHLEYRPVLGRVVTAITSALPPGVELVTVDGRLPGLFLRNGTTEKVRVLGPEGELFAEFWPDGSVVANKESRVFIEDGRARGGRAPEGPLRTDSVIRVASSSTYSWLDLRLRYPEPAIPDDVQRSRRPTVLVRWTIPIEVADVRTDITGTTSFVPFAAAVTGEERSPMLPITVAAVGVAGVLVVVVLRRRLRGRPGAE